MVNGYGSACTKIGDSPNTHANPKPAMIECFVFTSGLSANTAPRNSS